jgi:RND family efflux transporter MFP subunit
MKRFPIQKRTIAIVVVLVPLMALFIYVALRSGPLAPVAVTVARVETQALTPALFGIGTVEARYSYKVGPTFAGRIKRLNVDVGDYVQVGQVLGEMDPVDLTQRIQAQSAAFKRAEAQLNEARSRYVYAQTQAERYIELLAARATSEEISSTKKHELVVAEASVNAARAELVRVGAERDALIAQSVNLTLLAPVDGLITLRNAEPGTTLVAGQAVVEMIDQKSLWVNVRFDQIHAHGIRANLAAQIVLRTQAAALPGRILRVEPLADAVTEELLAKVVFANMPEPLPAVGELAEVTVALPALATAPVIPAAAIQRNDGQLGVWQVTGKTLQFTPITLGTADLEGQVQVSSGLQIGDKIIVYSAKALTSHSNIDVVAQIPGVAK